MNKQHPERCNNWPGCPDKDCPHWSEHLFWPHGECDTSECGEVGRDVRCIPVLQADPEPDAPLGLDVIMGSVDQLPRDGWPRRHIEWMIGEVKRLRQERDGARDSRDSMADKCGEAFDAGLAALDAAKSLGVVVGESASLADVIAGVVDVYREVITERDELRAELAELNRLGVAAWLAQVASGEAGE